MFILAFHEAYVLLLTNLLGFNTVVLHVHVLSE